MSQRAEAFVTLLQGQLGESEFGLAMAIARRIPEGGDVAMARLDDLQAEVTPPLKRRAIQYRLADLRRRGVLEWTTQRTRRRYAITLYRFKGMEPLRERPRDTAQILAIASFRRAAVSARNRRIEELYQGHLRQLVKTEVALALHGEHVGT